MQAIRAFMVRELRAAVNSRLIYAFPCLLLFAGLVAHFRSPPDSDAAAYYLLQALLYLVPLSGFLVGTGSAHGDREEMELIRSQPVRPLSWIAGKFISLVALFALSMLLLVVSTWNGLGAPLSLLLWMHGVALGAFALAAGIAVGMWLEDAVKAHLASLFLWLVLTFGFSAFGYFFASAGMARSHPGLWAGVMMASPLESLRVGLLFRLESTPINMADAPPLVDFWLQYSGIWFACITFLWTALALVLAGIGTRKI